ncbi:MAG: biopolymer transport protein ExbB [Verrucomicrobiales bacterium]|jgi:biopolymer transport protein ExbB
MPFILAGIFQAVPDAFESVWNFFYAGKLFMFFLVGLSILSITVIIYKALDLRRRLVLPGEAVDAIERAPASIDSQASRALAGELRRSRSSLGRLSLVALSGDHADKSDASRAVEARAREEIVELESGVALLEVVITIAPLLGLLGTVSGLVNVFSNLGDTADNSAIAMGIAEALNTTIAGLAIAVPTVVAHSYFMKKIERMGVRMEILLGGLLASIYREPSDPHMASEDIVPQVSEVAGEEAIEMPPVVSDPYPEEVIYQPSYPQPETETLPETEPGFPRLLAGHQPEAIEPAPAPAEIEYPPELPDPQQPS